MSDFSHRLQHIKDRYPDDYAMHTGTRLDNDRRLLPIAEQIASGQSIENLERFAKAYLGLFLDMDNSIPPHDRIAILANPPLAELIYQGFEAVLNQTQHVSARQIADCVYGEEIASGYVLLAAMDVYKHQPAYSIARLDETTVIAIVCFHYAYKFDLDATWQHELFLSRPQVAINALLPFWQQLIRHNTNHLPGIYNIIQHHEYDHISAQVLLPVLTDWSSVRRKLLSDLLRCALRCVDHEQLYQICCKHLDTDGTTEPRRTMLWLACAFLLHPLPHTTQLFDYSGRSKEKIIPLLDFIYLVFHTDELAGLTMPATSIANLVHIIAAKIAPQRDRYGELCDNTRKVMFLFFYLCKCENKTAQIKRLSRIRVMKLYNHILKFIDAHTIADRGLPVARQLDDFLQQLMQQQLITARLKWSD